MDSVCSQKELVQVVKIAVLYLYNSLNIQFLRNHISENTKIRTFAEECKVPNMRFAFVNFTCLYAVPNNKCYIYFLSFI